MRKFNLHCIITLAIVFTFSLCPAATFANTTVTPHASDYIGSYQASANTNGSGKVTITSKINTLYTDSVSIDVTLQVLDNGVWKDQTSWHNTSSNSFLTIDNHYTKAVSGKKYRAVVKFNALVSGKIVETRSMNTSSVTAY